MQSGSYNNFIGPPGQYIDIETHQSTKNNLPKNYH